MRFRHFFLLAPLSVAFVAASFPACTESPKLDDLCGWLGDPKNCYRSLAVETLDRCGAFGTDVAASKGKFSAAADRTNLETCVLDRGGNVKFDPPLDVTQFPLETISFVITNKDATTCGSGSMGANGSFSVTIDPFPALPEDTLCTSSAEQICGGKFSLTGTVTSAFSVTCPSQTSFNFSFEQTARCDEVSGDGGLNGEEKLDQLVPRAELLTNAGNIGVDGFVKFRVFYPLDPPVTGPTGKDSMTGTEMKVVEYFNCAIPGAPVTCANEMKDDDEADIDCGIACNKGCQDGAMCEFPQDCLSGYCPFDAMGILKCAQNPNCNNMMKDDLETDVDCGGTQCAKCAVDQDCKEDSDCESGLCTGTFCSAPVSDAGVPDSP